jgi:hypothetical protein
MCSEASTVLSTVAQISSLTVGVLEITSDDCTYQGVSTICARLLIGNILEFLCWKWNPDNIIKCLLFDLHFNSSMGARNCQRE